MKQNNDNRINVNNISVGVDAHSDPCKKHRFNTSNAGASRVSARGITLIALVITIIILLILAGVALTLTIGQNGIINKAKTSKEEYSEAQARDKLELTLLDLQTDKLLDSTYNEGDYINQKLRNKGFEIEENTVSVDGWLFEIDRNVPKIVKGLGQSEEYVQSDLIAWYDGIENTGNGHDYNTTVWKDLTGNNETGATINGATWTPNGLLFDGSNDWVNMNSILMPETDDFSIDIVTSVHKYDTNNSAYMLAQNNSSSDVGGRTGIGIYNTEVGFVGASCTDGNQIKVYDTKLTEKVNVTVTRKSEKIEIWINGQKKGEYTKEGGIISQINTVLGRWGMYNKYYFKGVIYSIKVYNKALNTEDIQKNYNQNNKRFNIEEVVSSGEYVQVGLIAWYDGIENTENGHDYNTTVWKDLTGNNETGATINGATWAPNGLLFDGSNDWVNMNSILMPETDDFSIDIVTSVHQYDTNNSAYMLAQNNSSSDVGGRTGIGIYNTEVGFVGASCTDGNQIKVYDTKLTEKVNVTVTRKSEKIEIWINGQKKGEYTKERGSISQLNTVLGRWGMYNKYYLNGVIYSVKAYNRTLSTEEIQQNYNVNKLRFNM